MPDFGTLLLWLAEAGVAVCFATLVFIFVVALLRGAARGWKGEA